MSEARTERMIQSALADTADLEPLRPEDVPLFPLFWTIMVEPLTPKKQSSAGIVIADSAREVEKIQNTVGRVLRLGELAFTAKTASGMHLGDDMKARSLKPGDYVLFARYTGQEVKLKRPSGPDRTVILLSDSELLAVVADPEVIRFWI